MSARITLHSLIAQDLHSALVYYEGEGGPRLSSAFLQDVEATLTRIAENPRRHHFIADGVRRAGLLRFPYHLLYEEKADEVAVLVLRHDRRHPSFGISRR